MEKEVVNFIAFIVVVIIIVISAALRGKGKAQYVPINDDHTWYGKMRCHSCSYRWQSRKNTPPAKCPSCGSKNISPQTMASSSTVNDSKRHQQTKSKTDYAEAPRRSKTPYEVLSLRAGASPDEVTEAYRKMASLYHPDKVAHLAPEFQVLAEQRMKEINAAYQAIQSREGSGLALDGEQQTNEDTGETINLDPDIAEMTSTARIYRDHDDPYERDELYEEALAIVIDIGRASTSVLQRRLSIGYGRAAKILDAMECEGFIGPAQGSKPRKVLPAAYEFLERIRRPND